MEDFIFNEETLERTLPFEYANSLMSQILEDMKTNPSIKWVEIEDSNLEDYGIRTTDQ